MGTATSLRRVFIRSGWVLLCLLYVLPACRGETQRVFDFRQGAQGWRAFGSCEAGHQTQMGHRELGSLAMSCVAGQEHTFYHKYQKLKPGRYRLSAWLRAWDVRPWRYGDAIWIFYDGGAGTKFVVRKLHGSFSWSKVIFTLDVKTDQATVWFRLKAGGQLWIDDVKLVTHKGRAIQFQFSRSVTPMPRPLAAGQGQRCVRCYRWWPDHKQHCPICGGRVEVPQGQSVKRTMSRQKERMLASFEAGDATTEKGRYDLRRFSSKRATHGARAAVLRFGAYNHMHLGEGALADWSAYDDIAMDVYNPLPHFVPFAVCVNDKKRSGYWDQLNHEAKLAPGWNRLRFSLRRYVGERGSVRIRRYVNLRKVRWFWFAIAPEDKRGLDGQFLIDHIRLLQAPPSPQPFAGLRTFDFVKEDFRAQRGFTAILPRHRYHAEVGFGFRRTKVWRLVDSMYADDLLRDAILVNRGEFVVDVPNDEYVVHLYASHLGQWYEHFWKQRKITVQGKVWLSQKRRSAVDYLRDFLRFQDIEPQPDDHPYDLYLTPLLKAMTKVVKVTNGQLRIAFDGDDSGVALNALIFYPLSKQTQGRAFLKRLRAVQRATFDKLARRLKTKSLQESGAISAEDRKQGLYVALVSPMHPLRSSFLRRSMSKNIVLEGGIGQRPVQALWVRNLGKGPVTLQVRVSALRGADSQQIDASALSIRYGVEQFMSHQVNHESYELAPRFLRPLPVGGLRLTPGRTRLLWVQWPITTEIKAGAYSGQLTLRTGNITRSIPIQATAYDFRLPPVDIPIGYLGLDPVRFDYFHARDVGIWQQAGRQKALRVLKERGFSTWSSLPHASVKKTGKKWQIVAPGVDRLMSMARQIGFSLPVFSYGGRALSQILKLDQSGSIAGTLESTYRRRTEQALRAHMIQKKWLPVIYQFSDEATGYSQKVERDVRRGMLLKQFHPSLRRGGFTHPLKKRQVGGKLQALMTDISLSSFSKALAQKTKQRRQRWGLYNAAIGLFEHGRATFGEGLYAARVKGATHRLGWHFNLAQNYPYYDLDGRENDAMMVFPRTDGSLDLALKLEWATMGVEDYRLLLLLRQLAMKSRSCRKRSLPWLLEKGEKVDFFQYKHYPKQLSDTLTAKDYEKFRQRVTMLILACRRTMKAADGPE